MELGASAMKKLMGKRFWLTCTFIGVALVSLSFSGCSKKGAMDSEEGGYVSDEDVASGKADSDSENAMGLMTINFPYDSSDIVGEQLDRLNRNVQIMKSNSGMRVQIEGHCDERGGIQYNLALGERRANAIALRMAASGVSKSRISTISMGKEKPVASGSNEETWAQNRRGNFVITER